MMIYIRWCCQGAGMALVFLLGALFGPRILPESAVAAEKRTAPPKVIQAQAFEVVDVRGVVRGAFRMKDDYPIISLYDRNKHPKVDLWLSDGDPVLQMSGVDGRVRLCMSVYRTYSFYQCYDGNGHVRVAMGVNDNRVGSSYMQLFNTNGKPAISLWEGNNYNYISCTDDQGNNRSEMRVTKDGPSLALYEKFPQPSLQLLGGTPFTGLALYQPDKQRRAWYGLEEGIPSFGLQDTAGVRRLEGALTPEGARLRALDEKGAVMGAWPGK